MGILQFYFKKNKTLGKSLPGKKKFEMNDYNFLIAAM